MAEPKSDRYRSIGENRQARHNYFILETYEAGIELKGSEVKSLREGGVQLKEGYAHVENGEMFLEGVHISPYSHSRKEEAQPVRTRRLLMHRREIHRIHAELQQKRLTLVPLRIYFKNGRAKLELGLAKGKKTFDKRASIKERELRRSLERVQRPRR
ncbi:MAG: SsrA-binding protein SmpB [Pseudomonadota bacterium]